MFAFLNNSHEANIAVYTPERADARAPTFSGAHARSKAACSTHTRTGSSAWRSGRSTVAKNQPEWTVVQPGSGRHLDRRPEVHPA